MNTRKVLIGVTLAVVAVLIVALLAGGGRLLGWNCYGYGSGMMRGLGFPFGMHTLGGGILMLLFWGAIIGGGVLLVASLTRQKAAPVGRDETPLEILKRRYASGEIDRDEFERVKESLLS